MSAYNGAIYRDQGGNRLVIGPGGSLDVQGGSLSGLSGNGTNFYVDSVGGAAGNDGLSWGTAKATLAQAVALATASSGDIIHLAPHHAQTVTGAAGEGITKAGIRVIGYGVGRQRPTFTFTSAAAASFDITAANCAVINCCFVNGIDSQTAMVNVSAADVSILGCEFQLGDASTQALLGILTTAAANRFLVEGCHLHGTVDAGVTGAIRIVGGDSVVICDNVIQGAFAVTGAIENVTTAATNVTIAGNFILNQTADGDNKTIVLHADGTGLIVNNRGGIIDTAAPAPVTAAAAWVAGNYWSSNVGVTASVLM